MIRIDDTRCDRCAGCISVCPEDALILIDKLTVSAERCISCGKCVKTCPVGALSLEIKSKSDTGMKKS
jgi:ferredoxin